MKTGLVLEGGAMRGMYTAGVLDVMLDEDIHVDGVIGVSAGVLFGVNYLSKQRGRSIRYNKRFNGDKRYMGMHSLFTTGNIVNTEFAYYTVPYELDVFDDETFMNSGVPFYAVVTNMQTGKPEYMKIHSVFDQMEVLRASASMPLVSKPVYLDGVPYLDGGIADSIPYEKMMEMGYDRIIVVLTRDFSYRKKSSSKLPAELRYHKYPEFRQTLEHRYEANNASVAHLRWLEKQGKVFVIRPSAPIGIKRIEKDADKLQEVYELGLHDGEHSIHALQEDLHPLAQRE